MTDIMLRWDADRQGADLVIDQTGIATDDSLLSSIIISLFSDARASVDADLPEAGSDRRGWWGDAMAVRDVQGDGRSIGSLLWLLHRSKALQSVVEAARDHARAALNWLVEEGVAKSISVEAERQTHAGTAVLAMRIIIQRPDGPMREKFDLVWNETRLLIAARVETN